MAAGLTNEKGSIFFQHIANLRLSPLEWLGLLLLEDRTVSFFGVAGSADRIQPQSNIADWALSQSGHLLLAVLQICSALPPQRVLLGS